jgi:hypothetical protein
VLHRRELFGRAPLIALTLVSLAPAGCSAPEATPYEFVVRVTSDPERPLAGALLLQGTTQLGATGEDGSVRLTVRGNEGEIVNLDVRCPERYRSPTASMPLTLHRLADGAHLPEFSAVCPPNERSIVVAVRADGAGDLPVLYLGQELARTDASGAAHVLFSAATDTPFELTLSTRDREDLRPQNPSMKFIVRDRDDLLTFDQKFIELPPEKHAPKGTARRAAPAAAPKPSGPVRLTSGRETPDRSFGRDRSERSTFTRRRRH